MKSGTREAVIKIGVGLMCLIMIALCGLFLYGINKPVYYTAVTMFVAVAVVFCAADGQKTPHLSRTALAAAIFLTFIVGLYMLYYLTGLNKKFTDFDALRSFIVGSGYWGYAVYVGLTVFQVVVLPVPAALVILLGVAIYGATVSFVLSVIGTLIGSVISFSLGKIFGRRLCNWMFGEENTNKYAQLLNEKGRFIFIIMLLFPAFPDDMLCMIAGITSMSYGYFLFVCALTRPVMIGVTAYLGSGLIPFSGRGIPIWIAIVCIMLVLFVVVTGLKSRIEQKRLTGRQKRGKTLDKRV